MLCNDKHLFSVMKEVVNFRSSLNLDDVVFKQILRNIQNIRSIASSINQDQGS